MGRTKIVRVVEREKPAAKTLKEIKEIEELEELEDGPTEEEIEDAEKLADFQSRFSGRLFKVRIDKLDPADHEWGWCIKLPLEGFDPFAVMPKYGPGQYKAILFDDNGKFVKGGTMNFKLNAPTEQPKEPPPDPLQNPSVILMLESMKTQMTMVMDLFKASMSSKPVGNDMAAMIESMSKIMGMAPKDGGVKSLMEAWSLFEKLKESVTPDEEDKGGLVSDLKEAIQLLPLMKGLAEAPGSPLAPAQGPRLIQPGQVQTLPANGKIVQPETKPKVKASPAIQKILFYVPKLEEAAKENQDVEKWGEFVLNVFDSEVVPALIKEYNGFVTQDSIYDRLILATRNLDEKEKIFTYAPTLLVYRDWIYKVIDSAIKILETSTEESAPAESVPA